MSIVYGLDINMDRVEDVLLHQKLLASAKDPDNQPVFHIRFLENVCNKGDDFDGEPASVPPVSFPHDSGNNGVQSLNDRNCGGDFETCSKLEDLNLDVRKNSNDVNRGTSVEDFTGRQEALHTPVHEVIFSTVDKPKLLSQVSALLSDIGLNIREAHVFSTIDGYSLDVFVVDGWHTEQTSSLSLNKATPDMFDLLFMFSSRLVFLGICGLSNSLFLFFLESPIINRGRSMLHYKFSALHYLGSWSGSSRSQSIVEKTIAALTTQEEWEIDWRLLKMGKKSLLDLVEICEFTAIEFVDLLCHILQLCLHFKCFQMTRYRGVYLGQDVAIKVLRSEHLNNSLEVEFAQEVAILRQALDRCLTPTSVVLLDKTIMTQIQVQHENVVRFIGACTKLPHLCIVTEYMPGGSLYDYLHKNHLVLKLPQLLKFAIDVCKGMEYLHQKNVIHRDLKTANLLMDTCKVVKVADFGVARFQNKGGVMTAETGTYRWMAPEVINHQPYDQKADVFSFAIVLWELVTAKIPYDTMTPLQAALGVRQGLRPELPENAHPKLLDLMQRCWGALPSDRPSFSEIRIELEELLPEVHDTRDAPNGC
ncbi:hypothetical protein DH2020_047486 [Rehmannia glutinosa]|uniref:Serine/threonine-protein kinase n=1 Tax=Rehmannia glutinosa TaxID=99300 RepID=A0ABR0U9F4_REHGL